MGDEARLSRRDVIGGAAACALLSSLPARSIAQSRIDVTELREGIALFRGAGANVVVVDCGGKLVAIDGGRVQQAEQLLVAIAGHFDGARPRILFNTNWGPEHTGLNDILGPEGARIIAHENTKLWMDNNFHVAWQDADYRRRASKSLPNETYYTSGSIEVGGDAIEFGYALQAHTDGDLYVRLRRGNVLVVSDLLAVDGYPVVDYVTGGWIGGMIAASKQLLDIADSDTLIVPAFGPPQGRAAIAAQLELCTAVFEELRQAYTSALSVDEFLATSPVGAASSNRGDPDLFLRLAYKSVWGHIRDLGWSIV